MKSVLLAFRAVIAFSSTRSCFIAYGFRESTLEMQILRSLLEQRGIEAVEAGGHLAPGQNAFCKKICSKVITYQFCVVLLNNDRNNNIELPNANVNMEYGLMLGFNKYVIPFQREDQALPFNVAGLDTIKYNNENFYQRAAAAMDQAIDETKQETDPVPDRLSQLEELFLLNRNLLVTAVDNEGEGNIYRLGSPLGFNLLNNFDGNTYVFFGRFASLRPEAVIFRIRKLQEIIRARHTALPDRVQQGIIAPAQLAAALRLFDLFHILVIVNTADDKAAVLDDLGDLYYPTEVLGKDEAMSELEGF